MASLQASSLQACYQSSSQATPPVRYKTFKDLLEDNCYMYWWYNQRIANDDIYDFYWWYNQRIANDEIYDIYVNRTRLHWFLVVSAPKFCFTLELRTPEYISLLPYMRNVSAEMWNKLTPCGQIKAKLSDILEVADGIIAEMRTYNVVFNNCQDFCNKFLKCCDLQQLTTVVVTTQIWIVIAIIIAMIAIAYRAKTRRGKGAQYSNPPSHEFH